MAALAAAVALLLAPMKQVALAHLDKGTPGELAGPTAPPKDLAAVVAAQARLQPTLLLAAQLLAAVAYRQSSQAQRLISLAVAAGAQTGGRARRVDLVAVERVARQAVKPTGWPELQIQAAVAAAAACLTPVALARAALAL